jgi:predicted esterase
MSKVAHWFLEARHANGESYGAKVETFIEGLEIVEENHQRFRSKAVEIKFSDGQRVITYMRDDAADLTE